VRILADPALSRVRRLYLLDINKENTAFCKKRFAGTDAVVFRRNNGYNFRAVKTREARGIFCYDATVRFEYDAVAAYVTDAFRVLVPGGRALLHHSNYDRSPGANYRQNPRWRNFMSKNRFPLR
jgi:cyclopropane fatty-acyl-phospholipid synthase-like methyltransferase